jgi:hypothetical protein
MIFFGIFPFFRDLFVIFPPLAQVYRDPELFGKDVPEPRTDTQVRLIVALIAPQSRLISALIAS